MKVRDAGILARQLMNQHGLHTWRLVWTEWHATVARCERQKKIIYMSRPFTLLNSDIDMRDVILHEIAHALTPGDHNEVWRATFIRIGGSGHEHVYLVSPRWQPRQKKIPWSKVKPLQHDPLDWAPSPVL